MSERPNFYAIIPASVRYDNSLSANAKILYGEITALTSVKGYCWASNAYFAKLYGVKTNAVSLWIKQLIDAHHIYSVIDSEGGNKRTISIVDPIPKKGDSYPEKRLDPIPKKGEHINTVSNTSSNKEYTPEFETFWKQYRRNTAKREAFKNWLTRLKEGVTVDTIMRGLDGYNVKLTADKTEPNFVMHAKTFVGPNRRYEDFLDENIAPEQKNYTDKNDNVFRDGKKIGHYDGNRLIRY